MEVNRNIETESLAKGNYHLKLAAEYFDDFRRSCHMAAKNKAASWLSKLSFVLTDVYSSLTPESRERFAEEIVTGDVLFHESISNKWVRMTPAQRELLETLADGILEGEKIEIERLP